MFTLEIIKNRIKLQKKHKLKMLDVGIVPGHLSLAIKKLFSLHISGISYEIGEKFTERMHSVSIPIYKCNVEKERLPFKDETFDMVLCCELIEHLIFDPIHMLNETNRVIKDGILILTTPNLTRLANRVKLMLGKSINWPIKDFYERSPYDRHNREYTLDEIKYMLSLTGFKIVKIRFFNYHKDKNSITEILFYMIRDLLTFFKPSLSSNILIVAKKCMGASSQLYRL